VRSDDKAQRVQQLADDQREQYTVEDEHRDVDGAVAPLQATEEPRDCSDEDEDTGDA
jgi:hypothetical protein